MSTAPELTAADLAEHDEEVYGMLEMFLNMCAEPPELAEGWEADSDSMLYCLNECRAWIAARRAEAAR